MRFLSVHFGWGLRGEQPLTSGICTYKCDACNESGKQIYTVYHSR